MVSSWHETCKYELARKLVGLQRFCWSVGSIAFAVTHGAERPRKGPEVSKLATWSRKMTRYTNNNEPKRRPVSTKINKQFSADMDFLDEEMDLYWAKMRKMLGDDAVEEILQVRSQEQFRAYCELHEISWYSPATTPAKAS